MGIDKYSIDYCDPAEDSGIDFDDELAYLRGQGPEPKATNIQHSSKSDSWMTPVPIVEMAREVLGAIDLDPATSRTAQERVKAAQYFTEQENGLQQRWWGNVFINPPGGKIPKGQPDGNKSLCGLFWKKLMEERGIIDHAIFLFFSVEGLANTQDKPYLSAMDFPFCIPAKRIKFDNPNGGKGDQPTHANAISYIPGKIDNTELFVQIFSKLGKCKR